KLVHDDLFRGRRGGMTNGPPPQHRYRALGLAPGHMRILKVILRGSVAFHRSGIEPAFHPGRERSSGHDRLPNTALPETNDLAVLTHAGGNPVIVHGTVAATGDIILARPNETHRVLSIHGLRDRGRFRDVIRLRVRTSSKGATRGKRGDE